MDPPNGQITTNILVTSALPYANGPIHIGIWSNTFRPTSGPVPENVGHDLLVYLCDDAHGTPIMLKAQQRHHHPSS